MTTENQRGALEALKYFKPPFIYEPIGQTIYCVGKSGNSMALQVRGWGELIGGGAFALDPKEAATVQDQFGEWIAKAMNEALTPAPEVEDLSKALSYAPIIRVTVGFHGSESEKIALETLIRAATANKAGV